MTLILVVAMAAVASAPAAAQLCSSYLASMPKDHRLFLYLPTSDDSTFPTDTLGNISGVNSQPLGAFTSANIDADLTASTAQLRNLVIEQVTDSFCEFSVEVTGMTSEPTPTGSNWQVVGVGGDSGPGGRFGRAQDVDTGDADDQDYARVWARGFHDSFGSDGDILSAANQTLERWAAAIAGTTAHEAGHNYGVPHSFANAQPGEDATQNHLLATGTVGPNNIGRVSRRHFSDLSFETMAYNLGLNSKTLSNWDFVNPNSSDATGLRIRLLSTASSVNLTWVYSGNLSPWTNPTLVQQAGTQNFRGTNYNIFDLTFSTGKSWSNGASGVAPPGVEFHVGAAVDEEVIVYDVVLTDSGGDMDFHPRMFGYDFGVADDADDFAAGGPGAGEAGDAFIRFLAPEGAAGDLLIEDVEILFLPRPVALEQMVEGGELLAIDGVAVSPFQRRPTREREKGSIITRISRDEVGETYTVPIAAMTDRRHIDVTLQPDPDVCGDNGNTLPLRQTGRSLEDSLQGEDYCEEGLYLSLFPATSVYVTATVVDPDARYFDRDQGRMVTGPLRTRLYGQFAGTIPDFNENGIDDYREIREGSALDENRNGIPDEAERGPGGGGSPVGDWSVYGLLGATLPDTTGLDSGFSGVAGVDRHYPGAWSAGARLGYHDFDASAPADDPSAVELSAHLERGMPIGPRTRIFAGGGLGAYFLDPGDTEFGGHVGVGAAFAVRPRTDFEVRAEYHEVFDNNLSFGSILAGLRVRF